MNGTGLAALVALGMFVYVTRKRKSKARDHNGVDQIEMNDPFFVAAGLSRMAYIDERHTKIEQAAPGYGDMFKGRYSPYNTR